MDEETAKSLDRLVERLDLALWEVEAGNFSVDVIKPSLYERLLSPEGYTDCE
jgi:hypothetical protein